jgi:hypothetical protein
MRVRPRKNARGVDLIIESSALNWANGLLPPVEAVAQPQRRQWDRRVAGQ